MFGREFKSILYLDLEGVGCELLAVWLGTIGQDHAVVRAIDMADAQQLMAGRNFDMLIVDDSFSGVPAAELCYQLRGSGQRSPVVVYSQTRDEVDRNRAAHAGADAYLIKPDEFALLATTIATSGGARQRSASSV